ncbi:MAG: hypothetical protein R2834_04980 [Rhodothermales bacterium]
MKRIFSILPALVATLLLSFMATGCDSSEDPTDLSQFIGSWRLVSASDDTGDKTAVFAALGSLTLDLNEDGTHVLAVDLTDPEADDVNLAGTYTVNDIAQQLLLAITFSGVPFNLTFDYVIQDADTVVLTANSTVIAALLGAEAGALLEGDVTLTIERTS